MKNLFTTQKGILVLLQGAVFAVTFLIFGNTIVEEPVKE